MESKNVTKNKRNLYSTLFVSLLLIVSPPVGLILMLIYKKFFRPIRIFITFALAIYIIGCLVEGDALGALSPYFISKKNNIGFSASTFDVQLQREENGESKNKSYDIDAIEEDKREYYKNFNQAKAVINDVGANDWTMFETVKFGRYEVDGNLDNGPEEIEWFVLQNDDEEIVLFSKYVLCLYKDRESFFANAFSREESELLSTDARNKSLYVISKEEVHKYFKKEGKELSSLLSTKMTPYLSSQDFIEYYGGKPIDVREDVRFLMADTFGVKNNRYCTCCMLDGVYERKISDRGRVKMRDYGININSLDTSNIVGLRPVLRIDFNKLLNNG